MTGLDTNVVVRFLTRDDPYHAQRALEVFRSGQLWLPKTVLLEIEWVLRSAYGLSPETILASFRKLMGLPEMVVEDRTSVLQALRWYAEGLDFADALHLASSGSAECFATFDTRLARDAEKIADAPPVEPP